MFVLMFSRSSSKLVHLESKTSSPGQIKKKTKKTKLVNTLEVTLLKYLIIINPAQNACHNDFYSTSSLKLGHLG